MATGILFSLLLSFSSLHYISFYSITSVPKIDRKETREVREKLNIGKETLGEKRNTKGKIRKGKKRGEGM